MKRGGFPIGKLWGRQEDGEKVLGFEAEVQRQAYGLGMLVPLHTVEKRGKVNQATPRGVYWHKGRKEGGGRELLS